MPDAEMMANQTTHRSKQGQNEPAHALTDVHGRFLSVDDRYCDILGRERHDIIGRLAVDFTSPGERAKHDAAIAFLHESEEPLSIRKNYVRSDGTLVRFENRISVLSDGIGPQKLVAVVQPLPPQSPVSALEHDLATAQTIFQLNQKRNQDFGHNRYTQYQWCLLLSCHIRECMGISVSPQEICIDTSLNESDGILHILDLINSQDMEFELLGDDFRDSILCLSAKTRQLFEQHVSSLFAYAALAPLGPFRRGASLSCR